VNARDAVRSSIGTLRARDLRGQARELVHAPSRWRLERSEVRAAAGKLRERPSSLVATIIATHDRQDLVVRAVESALAQTVTDQVVLVVADGGAAPQLPSHPRLHALALDHHTGVPGLVRNVGIRSTGSRYLAFLDDDNLWRSDHLERALAAHEQGADLTYAGMRQVDLDGAVRGTVAVPFDRRRLRNDGFVDTSTIVVRRSSAVHFARTTGVYGVYEDWNLVFRLSRRHRVELVPELTVDYLLHPAGHMQQHVSEPR